MRVSVSNQNICRICVNGGKKKSAPKRFINITVSQEVSFRPMGLSELSNRTVYSIAGQALRLGLDDTVAKEANENGKPVFKRRKGFSAEEAGQRSVRLDIAQYGVCQQISFETGYPLA